MHALVREAVDVRRLDIRMPGVAERVGTEIVEQDEQDVGPARRLLRPALVDNRP